MPTSDHVFLLKMSRYNLFITWTPLLKSSGNVLSTQLYFFIPLGIYVNIPILLQVGSKPYYTLCMQCSLGLTVFSLYLNWFWHNLFISFSRKKKISLAVNGGTCLLYSYPWEQEDCFKFKARLVWVSFEDSLFQTNEWKKGFHLFSISTKVAFVFFHSFLRQGFSV